MVFFKTPSWPFLKNVGILMFSPIMSNMLAAHFIDTLILEFDAALRTLCVPGQRQTVRVSPGENIAEPSLSVAEKRHVAGLMRVNHAGEVAAQALYQGQALTARLTDVKTQMMAAAAEEIDHLAWCERRLQELNSHPSKLNFLWYTSSFLIGALAGLAGDKWSLGFVVETEQQVTAHLAEHLSRLPEQETKTRAILAQMHRDEAHHAEIAARAGAAVLPLFIKKIMGYISTLLTKSSYYI